MPAWKRAGEEFTKVVHHPAGNGGVVHHQHSRSQAGRTSRGCATCSPWASQESCRPAPRCFCLARPNRQLHGQNRNAHDEQADEIDQDEKSRRRSDPSTYGKRQTLPIPIAQPALTSRKPRRERNDSRCIEITLPLKIKICAEARRSYCNRGWNRISRAYLTKMER